MNSKAHFQRQSLTGSLDAGPRSKLKLVKKWPQGKDVRSESKICPPGKHQLGLASKLWWPEAGVGFWAPEARDALQRSRQEMEPGAVLSARLLTPTACQSPSEPGEMQKRQDYYF